MFPKLSFLIYHNPVNHKVKIPVSVFPRLVKCSNIVGMKDSHRDTREFIRLMDIIRGKISVMTNQSQMVPYYRMGSAGCWSIDSWMGPWPVLHLRNLCRAGKDQDALQVISEIMAAAGGERPGGNEGATAKLPIEFAGYVNPGPARTPIIQFSDTTIERAKKKADGWKALCSKYRPLVEAERAQVKAAS
jgi:dihydrodipicolinate synthase/N-acetylneuraminate lyase